MNTTVGAAKAVMIEKWLDKAVRMEDKFLQDQDGKTQKQANMAFRRAMHLDGNEGFKGDVI